MMNRSQISNRDLWSPALPEASEEHLEQKPSPDLVARQPQGRDLSNRPQILIRSENPLPPWYGGFFQRVLEGPVSTKRSPQHPQIKSPPSASNCLSSATPSDEGGQPGASEELLGEQATGVYKRELTAEEEGFDSTEEFEEGDEASALIYFTHRAAVSSPHSTLAVAASAEAWRRKELLEVKEIRRVELLKLKLEDQSECQNCKAETLEVRFKEISVFARRVLFPCDAEFDPELEFSDSESESESEDDV